MNLPRLIAATALVTAPGALRANPIMDSGFMAVQVPGTRHVQLTFFRLGETDTRVATYLRDEKAWAVKWKPSPGFRAELGSGVELVNAVQACDCNVALGPHVFRVLPAGHRESERAEFFKVNLEVVADTKDPAQKPPVDSGQPDDGKRKLLRALIARATADEPMGLQGTNCLAECANVSAVPLTPPPK